METKTHTEHKAVAYNQNIFLLVRRLAVFVIGLWIMCFGIVAIVQAKFGVSPWDVLHLGIMKHSTLSFGRITQLVGIAVLSVACLLVKKWPSFGAVANMILVGEFCNMILRYHLIPDLQEIWARIALFAVGLILSGFGAGIYIESKLGAGPRDWLMLALHEKTGFAIRWVRTWLEVFAVGAGMLLGGPFALGTIIFSLTIGPLTEYGLHAARVLVGRFTTVRRETI